jgi:hypothetical protein
MTETPTGQEDPHELLSVDEVKPAEEGGPVARSGFNYQDEIAVGFLIEMLQTPSLLKMHCETHDDIVLVRALDGSAMRLAEFVQVKASELNKLWSLADLCIRKTSKVGTSIFEISFARDKHLEQSRFRLVTLRPVVNNLKMLTFPCGASGRESNGERFVTLKSELDSRFPGLRSPKGNELAYWIMNCYLDVRHSEAVRTDNLVRLIRLSSEEGRPLLPELADEPLDELRAWAKEAADAKWEPDRHKKIITREALRKWWEKRTCELIEGAATPSGGKLRQKMTEAELPAELVALAITMRRDYAVAARTSQYMEQEERERLQSRVKSEVMSLRARFAAGQLDLDSAAFHVLCLDRMDAVNAERPAGHEDRSAFLKGCMYDITDRCLLRFVRPTR